jgi:hypothetical protein
MSLPLVDFRGKLTHETDAVLEAISRATGHDRSEVARDALHVWALAKIHEASLIDNCLRREGLTGIDGGMAGNMREREGGQGIAPHGAAKSSRGAA